MEYANRRHRECGPTVPEKAKRDDHLSKNSIPTYTRRLQKVIIFEFNLSINILKPFHMPKMNENMYLQRPHIRMLIVALLIIAKS